MADLFYEETSTYNNQSGERRKYYIFKTLSIFFIVIAVVWGLMFFYLYDISSFSKGNVLINLLLLIIPLLSVVFLAIIFNMLKNKCCLDFDYVFVSGSIRISKVIKGLKRKNLYKFDTFNIEKIGKFGTETSKRYEKNPNVKTVILTANNTPSEGKTFYYMAVNGIDQKKLFLIFECTNLFIANVMKFTKSYVLEKDNK